MIKLNCYIFFIPNVKKRVKGAITCHILHTLSLFPFDTLSRNTDNIKHLPILEAASKSGTKN